MNNLELADRELFQKMAQHFFPKEFYFHDFKEKKGTTFTEVKQKTIDVLEEKWE